MTPLTYFISGSSTTSQISFGKVICSVIYDFDETIRYNPNNVQEIINITEVIDILLMNTPLSYIKYNIDAVYQL
jgi:hypothetical protein